MKRRLVFIMAFVLAALTFAAFYRALGHEFLNYDDEVYVTDNPHVQAGLSASGIAWAFTTMQAGNWHPLTWMSHMLDAEHYGGKPRGHHLTSLLLHIANTVLLFLLLNRMTGSVWRSAFVAGLFGIHPLHVESVAWIAERKDVLSTLFLLLTLWAYVSYARRPSIGRYLPVTLLFALGLMAKPMLVTLPFVLLLLDYWLLARMTSGVGAKHLQADLSHENTPSANALPSGLTRYSLLVTEKIPLFLLSGASCIITYIAQHRGGAVASFEHYPIGVRVANAAVSYVGYILKMLWPDNLAAIYPHPGGSLPAWQVVGSVAFLVVVTSALWAARRRPYVVVGWLWYLGTLVPAIGLIQVGRQAMADRYTYVPLIGLFIIAAWGIPDLVLSARGRSPTRPTSPTGPTSRSVILAAGLVLLALAICTWRQVGYWHDSMTLFQHAIAVTKGDYLAHSNLGVALFNRGDTEGAVEHFSRALEIKRGFAPAHAGLGMALTNAGRDSEAAEQFEAALETDPDLEDAHNNLGVLLMKQGSIEEATDHYAEALRINPDSADAHYNMALALAELGRTDDAIDHYSAALRIRPGDASAHHKLGILLAEQGRTDEAVGHLRRASELDPDDADILFNLGAALLGMGKLDEAAAEYRTVLRLRPDHAPAHASLAAILYMQTRYDEAREEVRLCRKFGGTPGPALLKALSERRSP